MQTNTLNGALCTLESIKMKAKLILSVLSGVMLLLFQGNLLAQANETSDPIKFNTHLIELGDVTKGEKVEFEFSFEVFEDAEISFLSTCECTEADYPRGKLKAGEVYKIPVIFDSSQKEEDEVVVIEIELTNKDPKINLPYFYSLEYNYHLVD